MSSSLLKSMLTTILSFISTTSNLSYTLHPLHSIIPMAHLLVPISTVISYPSLCTIHPTFNLIPNTPISLPSRPCIPIKIFHTHILCPSFISYTHHTHSSPWFKVAVSVTDSEGPEAYRSQCIGLVSGDT